MAAEASTEEKTLSAMWDLSVENAQAFIDFAIHNRVPREILVQDDFCQAILQRAYVDDRFFAQVFMDSFKDPMTRQRKSYWDILNDDTIPRALIVCYRGFGKTTGCITKAVKSICFQLERFILVVSKTHDEASRITENIKLELMCNRRIRAVFGVFKNKIKKAEDMEGMESVDFDLMFSRRGWFACDPQTGDPIAFVMPKGCEQQVRGLNIYIAGQIWRVTLLIIDDLESRASLQSEDQRDKIKDWVFDDLLPVVSSDRPVAVGPNAGRWNLAPGQRPPWRVIYIDTYKHEDSIVSTLIDSQNWKKKIFPMSELRRDSDGKRRFYSLVPELISDAQVRMDVRDAIKRNKMDGYCREFMCLPFNPANMMWTRDAFKRYKESELQLSRRQDITKFVIFDPSRTTNDNSCPCAALAFGVSSADHQIWIRREMNEVLGVEMQPKKAVQFCMETHSRILFVEVDGSDDWVLTDFRDEIARTGAPIQLIPLHAKKKVVDGDYGTGRDARKRADAKGALRYYKAGQIWHEEGIADGPLEKQELSWPNPSRWDSIDCLGHFKRACDLINLYFEVKFTKDSPRFEEDEIFLDEVARRRASNLRREAQAYLETSDYMRYVA